MPVEVPPLRRRREDIPLLAAHFVRRFSRALNRRIEGFTPEALTVLTQYAWPGNVREFQNIVERLVAVVEGPMISVNDLPLDLLVPEPRAGMGETPALPLKRAAEEFQRQIVLRVLERVRWNRSEAARILGVHRNSLTLMLSRWGLAGAAGDE
jgi:DNA-binding NtrC family response regulator